MRLQHAEWPVRWKRTIVAALMLVLLTAVPASALTFLGSWSFKQKQTGGAPSVVISSTDTASGGTLTLDMGVFSGRGSSRIVATRNFLVSDPSEAVTIARSFETLLQNANLLVRTRIKIPGGRTRTLADIEALARKTAVLASSQTSTATEQLVPGEYTLKILVRYRSRRGGSWDNSPPPPGSPHTFTIAGI